MSFNTSGSVELKHPTSSNAFTGGWVGARSYIVDAVFVCADTVDERAAAATADTSLREIMMEMFESESG
jgi:hypothetical protein